MALSHLLLFAALAWGCASAATRVSYEKCGAKGFTCDASKEISGKYDITFQCHTNVTTQDIMIYLWQFNSPATITSLTIQNCDSVQISFTCTGENKPIQWLKIRNVKKLEFVPTTITHNPPKIFLENVSHIETIPRHTFVQIKRESYKPGCFNPVNDLESVFFKNVNIGTIETEAFKNLVNMKNFSWYNVSVIRTNVNAIQMSFEDGECGVTIDRSNVDFLEPMALRLIGDGLSITRSHFNDIGSSAINGTIYNFEFINNTVANIQSGAIAILVKSVYMIDNRFQSIESGAFQKIGPGLLHDSKRNFGKLLFVYNFKSNLIESVGDGGIRPDIVAYKNVAAEVSYTYNTMQCSCEGMTWLGADVDLGYGFSVLKDFNTMILDPQNSNMCNFTPCMCFGVRSPNKKTITAATV